MDDATSQTVKTSVTAYGGGSISLSTSSVFPILSGQAGNAEASDTTDTAVVLQSGVSTTANVTVTASGGEGGIAGNATASGSAVAYTTTVNVSAFGGQGQTVGGSATATASGTGTSVTVNADAYGGSGTETTGPATAHALANGSTGADGAMADETITGSDGVTSHYYVTAMAPVSGATVVNAAAAQGTTPGLQDTTSQAVTSLVIDPAAIPDGTDLPGSDLALLTFQQGGGATSIVSGPQTSKSTFSGDLDLSTTPLDGDLLLDLHSADLVGTGVTGVTLFVDAGSQTILKQFTTASAADAYFTDDVLNLGTIQSLGPDLQSVDVSVELQITTDAPDSGFYIDATLATAPCYCRGTRILTPSGEIPVEDLQVGDHVTTVSGEARVIRWIGQRSYAGRFAARNRDIQPIVIERGALGDDLPRRDLWVSPLHALLLDGILIPARALLNGSSIRQASAVAEVRYFHLELDSHDVIYAEGAAAETFLDDDSRGLFPPAMATGKPLTGPTQPYAPRLEDGFAVEQVRRRLSRPASARRQAV